LLRPRLVALRKGPSQCFAEGLKGSEPAIPIAKAANTHVETLRYYERRGLVPKPKRITSEDMDSLAERGGFEPPVPRGLLSAEFSPSLRNFRNSYSFGTDYDDISITFRSEKLIL
jgi:hypothetical protein